MSDDQPDMQPRNPARLAVTSTPFLRTTLGVLWLRIVIVVAVLVVVALHLTGVVGPG